VHDPPSIAPIAAYAAILATAVFIFILVSGIRLLRQRHLMPSSERKLRRLYALDAGLRILVSLAPIAVVFVSLLPVSACFYSSPFPTTFCSDDLTSVSSAVVYAGVGILTIFILSTLVFTGIRQYAEQTRPVQ
jgi:hypothetical protein